MEGEDVGCYLGRVLKPVILTERVGLSQGCVVCETGDLILVS